MAVVVVVVLRVVCADICKSDNALRRWWLPLLLGLLLMIPRVSFLLGGTRPWEPAIIGHDGSEGREIEGWNGFVKERAAG